MAPQSDRTPDRCHADAAFDSDGKQTAVFGSATADGAYAVTLQSNGKIDIATVGSVMKAPLRQYGYPPTESVAVLAAAAAMGETIPPSLALLVLGSITTLSVGSLFVAGIVPAANKRFPSPKVIG